MNYFHEHEVIGWLVDLIIERWQLTGNSKIVTKIWQEQVALGLKIFDRPEKKSEANKTKLFSDRTIMYRFEAHPKYIDWQKQLAANPSREALWKQNQRKLDICTNLHMSTNEDQDKKQEEVERTASGKPKEYGFSWKTTKETQASFLKLYCLSSGSS